MSKLTITSCAPWDGEYEFDSLNLTNRELNQIKTISVLDGAPPIRAAEFIEAIYMSDAAAVVALTVVVLARQGKVADPDDFWDAPSGAIRLDLNPGDDADPPTTESSVSEPSEPATSSGGGSASGGG